MKFNEFVSSLSDEEFSSLSSAVYDRQRKHNEESAEEIILDHSERCMVEAGEKVSAIKSVRERCQCDLSVARMAVENYLDSLPPIERVD